MYVSIGISFSLHCGWWLRNPANRLVVYLVICRVFIHPNGGWPWDFWTINGVIWTRRGYEILHLKAEACNIARQVQTEVATKHIYCRNSGMKHQIESYQPVFVNLFGCFVYFHIFSVLSLWQPRAMCGVWSRPLMMASKSLLLGHRSDVRYILFYPIASMFGILPYI